MKKFILLLLAVFSLLLSISATSAFSGYYEIVNRHSGMVLDVAGWSTLDGGNVDQWTGQGGYNQQWSLTDVGGGYYKIINRNSSKALEVAGWSTLDGGNVDQWGYGGGFNQQWAVTSLGNGCYKIINRNSTKALDVAGWSTVNGGNIDQWGYTGNYNQQWYILPIGTTGTVSPASGGSGVAANTFKGFNWAVPTDNFVDGPLVLTGLNINDSYATVQATAGVVLGAFQNVGANTVRIPINPQTVIGTWWGNYKGAIDKATSMGMKVIICAWEGAGSRNGTVDDFPVFWQMWDTVVNAYNGNGNVYFEAYNEPYGYETAGWLNVMSWWMTRYPTVARGRILVEEPDQYVSAIGSSSIISGCLLSVHDYGFYNPSQSSEAFFYNDLSTRVGAYANRTGPTEFGAEMTAGLDYGAAPIGSNTGSMRGFTSYCHDNHMGSVYWYGARLNDGNDHSFSMFTFNNNSMSQNSFSGMYRVQWGWSY